MNLADIRRYKTVCLGWASDFTGLADGDHGNPTYGTGPLYVRATELTGGILDTNSNVRLDQGYSASLPSSVWASSEDVLFSIVATLGAVGVLEDGSRAVLSRGVAKVRPLTMPQAYLKAYMRTHAFGSELLRRSVGTIQRGVYLESLQTLDIPVIEPPVVNAIASNEAAADRCIAFSRVLTHSAKLLVERLIEGLIPEIDLVAAQKALEGDDRSADEAILQALRQSDAPGAKPLIPDLPRLYALLDELDGEKR
jgi:type I restriction enzyme S subunit